MEEIITLNSLENEIIDLDELQKVVNELKKDGWDCQLKSNNKRDWRIQFINKCENADLINLTTFFDYLYDLIKGLKNEKEKNKDYEEFEKKEKEIKEELNKHKEEEIIQEIEDLQDGLDFEEYLNR